MKKNENHIEPSKLTRFRSFEEMKSAPFSFPSSKSPTQRLAELEEAFAQLRSSLYTGKNPRQKKANKKLLK